MPASLWGYFMKRLRVMMVITTPTSLIPRRWKFIAMIMPRTIMCALPSLLKENLLAAAEFMEKSIRRAQKAEVYLIQYNGLLPSKTETTIPIPLPDGYIVSLAFSQYKKREPLIQRSRFEAKNSQGASFEAETELAQDIGAIADRSLENRKARVIAKAVASASAKYFAEKKLKKRSKGIWRKFGPGFSRRQQPL